MLERHPSDCAPSLALTGHQHWLWAELTAAEGSRPRCPAALADEEAAPSAGRPALPGCCPRGVSSTGREEAPKLINMFKARLSWLHRRVLTPRAGCPAGLFLSFPLPWASPPTLSPTSLHPGTVAGYGLCVLPANSPLFHRQQPEGQAIPRPCLPPSFQPVSPLREAFPKGWA